MYKKILPIVIMVVCVPIVASATCTIRYACGTGATGEVPGNQTVSTGKVFTPSVNTCTRDGYVFSHYLATPSSYTYVNDGVAVPNSEYTIPFNGTNTCSRSVTITLTAQWVMANMDTPTSQHYVDAELSTKQPMIVGDANGANKIMLFSDTTDGEFGSRDIVTTLGTPNATTGLYTGTDICEDPENDLCTNAPEIPTRGAVLNGLNAKQNTISGTANWVTTYTNTAGELNSKPIYNVTHSSSDALVEAGTLNAAIADAVNSELTQVTEDGTESSSGTLWRINTTPTLLMTRMYLDTSIDGSGHCTHELNDSTDDFSCSGVALPRGGWEVQFSYGNIIGRAWCSNISGTSGQAADSVANASLEDQYSNWIPTNSSPYGLSGGSCWCRMDNVNGYSVTSSWVLSNTYDIGLCASRCAISCSQDVHVDSSFRNTIFGENAL
ncbi:MAG: hypothetical protein J6T57_03220 [Alphaproteobacteria bacterium]|nr:hypothetical protein [Alphaproteobacteria bacterium]